MAGILLRLLCLMKSYELFLKIVLRPLDFILAILTLTSLLIIGLAYLPRRGSPFAVPTCPRLLYLGYTGLDQARQKGLLCNERDAYKTYNPSMVLLAVTVFVPIGKRTHVTEIARGITFIEHSVTLNRIFTLSQKALRIATSCLAARRLAMEHDVVMVGGPHLASIPGLFVRYTTRMRVVLFIEAFWEDILCEQAYMSYFQKAFWLQWYVILYKSFHAFVGGPSFKPELYMRRGMKRSRIWPYLHQVNASALELDSEEALFPAALNIDGVPLILSIGRLEKEKRSADCIDVAKRLASTGKDFCFVIVGDGSQRVALESQILASGLQSKILMVGAQSNAVTFKIAKKAVACFAPYMGTALVEALLAGCAVVAYDNDAHRGIAGDGPVSFVPHGDTAKSAEILASFLEDPVNLSCKRQESRKYAWNKWNSDAIADTYLAPLLGRGSPLDLPSTP